MWQTPKTDWTRNDEYNAADLNRVEGNTKCLADLLATVGYPVALAPVKTDRDYKGFEFADSLSRIEANIHALTTGFFAPPGYIPPKTWTALRPHDWRDANRVESNLKVLYDWIFRTMDGFKYCGTFYCGEGVEIA